MEYKCELCGKAAELTDKTVINNGLVEYRFCKSCYSAIAKSGASPFEYMQALNAKKGRECPVCGTKAVDFQKSFMFGCPDCYREMRELASSAASAAQSALRHVGKRPEDAFK